VGGEVSVRGKVETRDLSLEDGNLEASPVAEVGEVVHEVLHLR
jgi:hypothetical protein